jgi:alpha-amylase
MATFVSNHDIFAGRRLWDQVGGDEARYKLAAAGYLLQPGTPFVYYGEEIGQAGVGATGGRPADPRPMSWTADGARLHPARPSGRGAQPGHPQRADAARPMPRRSCTSTRP